MKPANKRAYRCATVILSALLVIASLSVTGCAFRSLIPNQSNGDENNTVIQPGNTEDGNAPENNGEGEGNKPVMPSYYDPLTGLASSADLSMIRPVAVSLAPNAPHFGFSSAGVVIEAPIEDGSTRLTLVTTAYRAMPQIGVIGSTRPYLLSLSSDFGAVNVCASANDIRPGISYANFPTMNFETDGATTVFYKNGETGELYTSGTRLVGALENFEKTGVTLPYTFQPYGTSIAPNGKNASGVIIPFSKNIVTQFLYDAEKGVYSRSQNAIPHTDAETGETVAFTNLLLLTCESSIHNKVTGTEFDMDTQSGGEGYYISCGRAMAIKWSRDADGKLLLQTKEGDALTINRGKTYIGLLDLVNSGSVLIVE